MRGGAITARQGVFSSHRSKGVGARRVEVTEEHEIYAQSYILFRAGSETPYRNSRRTLSVGPGLALDHDDDDRSESSSEDLHSSTTGTSGEERRGRERGRERGPPPALLNSAYASRRNMSVDQTTFQRDYIAHYDNGFSPTATASPPYTPVAEVGPPHAFTPTTLSPAASISHRMHTVDELPIQEAASVVSELGQRSRSEPDTERSSTSRPPVLVSAHSSQPCSPRLDRPRVRATSFVTALVPAALPWLLSLQPAPHAKLAATLIPPVLRRGASRVPRR